MSCEHFGFTHKPTWYTIFAFAPENQCVWNDKWRVLNLSSSVYATIDKWTTLILKGQWAMHIEFVVSKSVLLDALAELLN